MQLQEIQNNFISFLYDRNNDKILSKIKDKNIKKEKLFEIYRNNLIKTLINALKLTYPIIYSHLGDKKFNQYALEFIKNNPSKSNNLDDYGQKFLHDKDEFLNNLSQFEWLKHLSYFAKDGEIFDVAITKKLDPEKLFNISPKLNDSCYIYQSHYDFFSKDANQERKKTVNYLIYRNYSNIEAKMISKNAYIFLSAIKNNMTLFEIYEKYDIDVGRYFAKYYFLFLK